MAEVAIPRRAALNEVYQSGDFGELKNNTPGVTIADRPALSIIQVAAWEEHADAVVSAIQQAVSIRPDRSACRATQNETSAALWLGPDRWLIVEKEHRDLNGLIHAAIKEDMAAVTDQSHSRCVLRISGPQARNLLRKGTTQDVDALRFSRGDVRTTSLFHMNAVIHCLAEETIDIYVARSFGHSFYEVLCHAAMEYGYRVATPL